MCGRKRLLRTRKEKSVGSSRSAGRGCGFPGARIFTVISGRPQPRCCVREDTLGFSRHRPGLTSNTVSRCKDGFLQNFKLIAVLESTAEPWFPDARVKTCVTVIQRCKDAKRMATLVKFVRVKRPLADVIGCGADE